MASQREHRLRIVALGGGTGLPSVLRSLRLIARADARPSAVTAIVAVTDDGGSSGELRRRYHVLPPGDARNCVAALAGDDSPVASLIQHRLGKGSGAEGHPVGNLILTALTQRLGGDFACAVDALSRMARTAGRVVPATADDVQLRAEYVNGEVAIGETAIVQRRLPIRRLSLDRPARPAPDVIKALVNADVIIVGPGSLYTSVLPVLLVGGVASTISGLLATTILVSNLMTEPGETDGYSVEDHLDVIERHLGVQLFDYVLANNGCIPESSLTLYANASCCPVTRNTTADSYRTATIVERPLAWQVQGSKIRHDPVTLAAAIRELIEQSETAWAAPARRVPGEPATRLSGV